MEQVGDMKLYTLDEVKDKLLGKKGTPETEPHAGRDRQEDGRAESANIPHGEGGTA